MKKTVIAIIVLGLLIVILTGWYQYQRENYDRAEVSRGNIQIVVTAPGEIDAEKKANLGFKATGRISYLPVKENDTVKKWQTVANLDTSDLKAVKEKELKDYLDARWDWEQQREDYSIKGDYQITPNLSDEQKRTYEKKQFELNRSVIDVEIADRSIKNASLYAPFDGVVTQVNGEVNEWVSAFSSTPLVQIIDFSSLFFEAEVDQKDSDSISLGQKAIIKLDAKKGTEFTGVISEIALITRTTDGDDTVVPIKIKFDENPDNLKLGWEGDAQIILEEKQDVILIPKRAVSRQNGQAVVLVWQGKRLVSQPVKLGVFDGRYWEVLEGIAEFEELAFPK